MECKGIREKLSAYLEGMASLEETRIIEQHLRSCQRCSTAFEDLRKTGELLKGLEEVEVPPWFKQKVLSRVRAEEGAKRSVLQNCSTLPRQDPDTGQATVLIAVLVVYVFKSVEPEMKKSIQSPAVVGEVTSEDQVSKTVQESDRSLAPPNDQTAPGGYAEKDKGPATSANQPAGGKGALSTTEESAPSKLGEDQLAQLATKKKEAAVDQHEQGVETGGPLTRQEPAEFKQAPPAVPREGEIAAFPDTAGETDERRKLAAAPRSMETMVAKQRPIDVMVHVKDVPVAGREVENLLNQLGARKIVSESREGREIFTVELKAQDIRELFKKLKAIGEVKEEATSFVGPEGDVAMRIEILIKHSPPRHHHRTYQAAEKHPSAASLILRRCGNPSPHPQISGAIWAFEHRVRKGFNL
jgi:hypothetical protein